MLSIAIQIIYRNVIIKCYTALIYAKLTMQKFNSGCQSHIIGSKVLGGMTTKNTSNGNIEPRFTTLILKK